MGKSNGAQVSRSDIPEDMKKFANENLTIAGTISNMPHVQYQGDRIAGLNSMQRNTNDFIKGSDFGAGAAQGVLDNEITATAGHANMNNYVNPHENQVVNQVVSDMGRAHAIGQNQLNATAAGAGAFGGSRHGIANASLNRDFMDRVGATAGQLRHQGFTTAAGLGMADSDRTLQADVTDQQLNLQAGQQLGAAQQAKAAMMAQVGAQQQALDQANMDLAYGDFLDQQNAATRQLSIRQSALGQTPMGSIQRAPSGGGSSVGSTLSGLGTLAMGAAKLAPLLCWVAREIYGPDNPKWLEFREHLLTKAPAKLRNMYVEHGEEFAKFIADKPDMKAAIRLDMDRMLEAA